MGGSFNLTKMVACLTVSIGTNCHVVHWCSLVGWYVISASRKNFTCSIEQVFVLGVFKCIRGGLVSAAGNNKVMTSCFRSYFRRRRQIVSTISWFKESKNLIPWP